jgi:hypothetical protein
MNRNLNVPCLHHFRVASAEQSRQAGIQLNNQTGIVRQKQEFFLSHRQLNAFSIRNTLIQFLYICALEFQTVLIHGV